MAIRPPWLGGGRCYPGFLSGTCRLSLVGLRCLWVPRSCGVHGLRDGVTCLRSGLCSSSVRDLNEDFSLLLVGLVPGLRAGSPASGWRCVLRHALVLEAIPPSHRLVLLLSTGFLFSGPGWCGRLQPFSFSYVFLRDVVTLWVNSVFLSLLIANEGLHWWLFLFRYSHPFWGRVVVFLRPH